MPGKVPFPQGKTQRGLRDGEATVRSEHGMKRNCLLGVPMRLRRRMTISVPGIVYLEVS